MKNLNLNHCINSLFALLILFFVACSSSDDSSTASQNYPKIIVNDVLFDTVKVKTPADTILKDTIFQAIGKYADADLTINSYNISGTNKMEFTIKNNYTFPYTLKVNNIFSVTVTFHAYYIGQKSAELNIVTNLGSYTIHLRANVVN